VTALYLMLGHPTGEQPPPYCGRASNDRPGELEADLARARASGLPVIEASIPEFWAALLEGGKYIWSVSAVDSKLRIARYIEMVVIHPYLTNGEDIVGGGLVIFGSGGLVTEINNQTGHFTPRCACGADLQAGVDAFTAAGVPLPRRAIKLYGW
jgi:hypothetical protein